MTPRPENSVSGSRDGRRGVPIAWSTARVDAEFAALMSQTADTTVTTDRVPAAERLTDPAAGRVPGVAEQAGRIASALFCVGRLDTAFVAFAVRRTAEHGRVDPDEVMDLVATRVLAIAAGLLTADARTVGTDHSAPGRRDTRLGRVGRRGDDTTGGVPTAEAA